MSPRCCKEVVVVSWYIGGFSIETVDLPSDLVIYLLKMVILHVWESKIYPLGMCCYLAIENGPIEIVDLPIESMVM